MTSTRNIIPSATLVAEGGKATTDDLGMLPMQQRVWKQRKAQHLLVKAPPAAGKSRAAMYVALDKMHHWDENRPRLKRTVVAVPQEVIGASFAPTTLSISGFAHDWTVDPKFDLCSEEKRDDADVKADRTEGKIKTAGGFLSGEEGVLICTHATLRFVLERFGVDAFDDSLVVVDEFHHSSANPNNQLGRLVRGLMERGNAHILAMTGTYFRGDGEAILTPDDERKFTNVVYTYHERLQDCEHLKRLDIEHHFYKGIYLEGLGDSFDPKLKTIIHIPAVTSRESTRDKYDERDRIIDHIGAMVGVDESTGFFLVEANIDGEIRTLKVADLVDDDKNKRGNVIDALRHEDCSRNRDHVDIIIALGMAKEGFDWIWCEHALTVGYRASLTEVTQIIGRAARDAPGKHSARFTNMIAEPDVSDAVRNEAVNDTLKALGLGLLMEQVMAPKIEFLGKGSGPVEGYDYGENGYDPNGCNVGQPDDPRKPVIVERAPSEVGATRSTMPSAMELQGTLTPANKIIDEVVEQLATNEEYLRTLYAARTGTASHKQGNQHVPAKIVKVNYPDLSEENQQKIADEAVSVINLRAIGKAGEAAALEEAEKRGTGRNSMNPGNNPGQARPAADPDKPKKSPFVESIRKWIDVKDLNIDMIRRVNPLNNGCEVMAKHMDKLLFEKLIDAFDVLKNNMPLDHAEFLAREAMKFKEEHGRMPEDNPNKPEEQRMARGVRKFAEYMRREQAKRQHRPPSEGGPRLPGT